MNTLNSIPTPSPAMRSPWHSPVPYLFGGLAAMLGLIAFALLILACSYWRLSGRLAANDHGDLEAGSDKKPKCPPKFEEKFLVIMAGESTPTFLATPVSSKGSSFKSTCDADESTVKVDGKVTEEGSLGNIKRQDASS